MLSISFVLLICLLNVRTNAVAIYPICYATCMAACIVSEILLPPGANILDYCWAFCPTACALACVSPDTTVIRLDIVNQQSVIVPINEINPGDLVYTIADNS